MLKISLVDYTQWVGYALLLVVMLQYGLSWYKCARIKTIFIIIVLVMATMFSLLNGCNLLQIIRGIVGELSITTILVLAWLALTNRIMLTISSSLIVLFSLLFLYLSVFGFMNFDLYSYGYFPHAMLLVVVILSGILWFNNQLLAWVWLCALFAFYFKLQASNNLWDYLADPVLFFLLLCTLWRRAWDAIFNTKI